MLILCRLVGEQITIGDPVRPTAVVTIHRVEGNKVYLAFDAGQDVRINRTEVAQSIKSGLSVATVKRRAKAGIHLSGSVGSATPPPPSPTDTTGVGCAPDSQITHVPHSPRVD